MTASGEAQRHEDAADEPSSARSSATYGRELSGSVVLVTGAGSGIGEATARLLLAEGARVVAADRTIAKLDRLVDDHPDALVAVSADVASESDVVAAVEAGVTRWGRFDSVVANAGVGYYGGIEETSAAQIAAMTSTNILGCVWTLRSSVREFRRIGSGGDIVVVGSVAGMGVGGGGEAVYAATKAAQMQLVISLQREVRTEDIRVTAIAPAAVNTSFAAATGRFGAHDPKDGPFMAAEDVAYAIVTSLRQPRRMRTSLWELWSLAEAYG